MRLSGNETGKVVCPPLLCNNLKLAQLIQFCIFFSIMQFNLNLIPKVY